MSYEKALIYDAYEHSAGDKLHLVATGQHLVPITVTDSLCTFKYMDKEISLNLECDLVKEPDRTGRFFEKELRLDWRLPPYASIRQSYGQWRRISWFLLDAFLVWLEITKHEQDAVMLRAGWLNGRWRENVRLRSSVIRSGGTHRARLAEPMAPYDIFPLDFSAPEWRYIQGLGGAREGQIATRTLDDGSVLADPSIPVEVQLRDIPRFVSNDGAVLFFYRVVPHNNPEYAPSMEYGLLSKTHLHYFDLHGNLRGMPIALEPQNGFGVLSECNQNSLLKVSTKPRLHPSLREAQLFAGLEANGLRVGPGDVQAPEMPEMVDVQFGQSHRFGYGLGDVYDAPVSVGLPFTRMQVWSRLASEEDEPIDPVVAAERDREQRFRWAEKVREDLAEMARVAKEYGILL